MSVKINENPLYKAFEFEANVEAKMLTNSWGFKQDRIHILGYDGEPGKDPYAIASTRMNYLTDTDAKLGCIDRLFYVLHKHENIWYKLNIKSLQKRLNPATAMIISDKGVCENLIEVVGSSKASPILTNRFKEMEVWKFRPDMFPPYRGQPELQKNPSLEDLKDYCEMHESEIFKKLNSLNLPKDFVNQFKVSISSASREETKAQIKITLPYFLINGPFKLNMLEYNVFGDSNEFENNEFVTFTLDSREVDSNLSSEENFAYLMEDLLKTFKPWFHTVKIIAKYTEEEVFSQIILESEPWKQYQRDHIQMPHKFVLIPDFFRSIIYFSVLIDDRNIKMYFELGLDFKINCAGAFCSIPKFEMMYLKESSFEDSFSLWKDHFSIHFQNFLDKESKPIQMPYQFLAEPIIELDLKELDDLLELNGEMTGLEKDQKYIELKALVNKTVKAELLKCHPDKVLLLGLDPDATAERTQKLNELRKNANDYLDSII